MQVRRTTGALLAGIALALTAAGCARGYVVGKADIVRSSQINLAVMAEPHEPEEAYKLLLAITQADDFRELSPASERIVDRTLGRLALRLGERRVALDALTRVTRLEDAGQEDWTSRLIAAAMASDGQNALSAFEELQRRWPAFASSLHEGHVTRLDRAYPGPRRDDQY